jgi:hypothetical protein
MIYHEPTLKLERNTYSIKSLCMKKKQLHRTSTKDKKNPQMISPIEFFNSPSKAPIQDQNAPRNLRNFRPPKGFLPQVVVSK